MSKLHTRQAGNGSSVDFGVQNAGKWPLYHLKYTYECRQLNVHQAVQPTYGGYASTTIFGTTFVKSELRVAFALPHHQPESSSTASSSVDTRTTLHEERV